jgi:hypothetical protein
MVRKMDGAINDLGCATLSSAEVGNDRIDRSSRLLRSSHSTARILTLIATLPSRVARQSLMYSNHDIVRVRVSRTPKNGGDGLREIPL